jgi:hypothetical protein
MSQKHSLIQSRHSVQHVLTGYMANDQVVRHSQNKFLYSLIKVRNKDVSKSKSFGTGPTHES